jgi:hypothetical protein
VNAGATLANAAWLAHSLDGARRFARALENPQVAQEAWLKRQLARHAKSDFGRAHDFAAIRNAADFARRVPLTDYAGVTPHIERILRGERDVLSCGRVTHLAPTSGSTGARKLIPFSASLQQGFSAGVGPWMLDLARRRPGIAGGPAYWAVSPMSGPAEECPAPTGAIPIGHADDADYVGGALAWLVRQALAVPGTLRHVRDVNAFWLLTVLSLLRQRDLRLISVWHPSFLDLLVGAAAADWHELLESVSSGACPWLHALPPIARTGWRTAPNPSRAEELRRIGSSDWPRWWPRLRVVSCWGEQAAESGWQQLRRRLPHVLVQAKGLVATEAVVTIPWGTQKPLAVTSHFFEFLDERGELSGAHALAQGKRYQVVVTNGGGLWRYRLGDVVECTGYVRATPSLRFLGRAGCVSDLRGEKLNDVFVAEALRALWLAESPPSYAALRASEFDGVAGYELLLSDEALPVPFGDLGAQMETALRQNPHYDLARRLGQLQPLRVIPVAAARAREELASHRGRLGDAKPKVLLRVCDGMRGGERP